MSLGRILIVDNDDWNRRMGRTMLEANGFEVLEGESGEEGLAMAKLHKPDLLIVELMIPGINGWTLIGHLRNFPDLMHTPVMFLSRKNTMDIRAKAFRSGVDEFLAKPYHFEELVFRAGRVIKYARLREREIQKISNAIATPKQVLPLKQGMQKAMDRFVGEESSSRTDTGADESKIALDLRKTQRIGGKYINIKLRKMPIFSEIAHEDILQFTPYIKVKKYASGTVIIKKGEIGHDFFIIYKGLVEVISEDTILATLKAGECFGEMSLLSGDPVSATIQVAKPSIILKMNAFAFNKMLEKSPALASRFTKLLAQRIKKTNQRMTTGLMSGMSGQLDTIRFPELIQTLSAMDCNGVLQVRDGTRQGTVYFQSGRIIDTEVQEEGLAEKGEEGFYRLLDWEHGSFHFEQKTEEREPTITCDTMGLLLEGMRRFDEETWINDNDNDSEKDNESNTTHKS